MCFVLGLCVVLYLVFVLAGPVINREMYLLRATRTFGKKTDKLLINLTYCVWFLWARSQGHSHKIYVIIERARPHISPTPYSYTQPTAQDLQLIQLDDCHPPRQPPRRILSQLVANYGPC